MSTQILLTQIKIPTSANVGAVVTVQTDGTLSTNVAASAPDVVSLFLLAGM
jgi:hypothetical protein